MCTTGVELLAKRMDTFSGSERSFSANLRLRTERFCTDRIVGQRVSEPSSCGPTLSLLKPFSAIDKRLVGRFLLVCCVSRKGPRTISQRTHYPEHQRHCNPKLCCSNNSLPWVESQHSEKVVRPCTIPATATRNPQVRPHDRFAHPARSRLEVGLTRAWDGPAVILR